METGFASTFSGSSTKMYESVLVVDPLTEINDKLAIFRTISNYSFNLS
jgi:hypothetical protein